MIRWLFEMGGDVSVQPAQLNIIDLWLAVWGRKVIIVAVALGVGIVAVGASYLTPNVYRAQVLLAPAQSDAAGDRLAAIGGGIGGLATLAGLSMPQGSTVQESIAVLRSRQFVWDFVQRNSLLPVLFSDRWDEQSGDWIDDAPSLWDAYYLFVHGGVLAVSTDKDTGLVSVRIEWTDPELAAEWANALVAQLNDYLRQQAIDTSNRNLEYLEEELGRTTVAEIQQTIFGLIGEEQKAAMLANSQKEFAFRVLDAAAAPDRKVRPKRALIGVLTTFVAGVLMVVIVVGQFAYANSVGRARD